MLSYLKNILQTTTGKSSLEEVGEEQLQQLADQYSYFAAAQFLLTKKMYTDKHDNYKDALQKTALHFDNSLLLHFNFFEEINDYESDFVTAGNNDGKFDAAINTLSENETGIAEVITENEYHSDDEPSNDDDYTTLNEIPDGTSYEPNEKLSNLLKEQVEAFEKPVEETLLPIANIPHHRIDYFESQGIKFDPDAEANDKLGMQLKRFTDWLKQMKRINPNLNNLETDVAGEIQAQNMAARSNDTKEVVTEAMAEVLIKQGKPEQAIEIYEKLSFSNPSKTAYFAAKIKELKT